MNGVLVTFTRSHRCSARWLKMAADAADDTMWHLQEGLARTDHMAAATGPLYDLSKVPQRALALGVTMGRKINATNPGTRKILEETKKTKIFRGPRKIHEKSQITSRKPTKNKNSC